MNNLHTNQKGVTLMEVLIYLAIFGVLFLTIVQFTLFVQENNSLAQQRNQIEKNVLFIDQNLQDTFYEANINEAQSLFEDDDGYILMQKDSEQIRIFLDQGDLKKQTPNGTFDLNYSSLQVTRLYLEKITNTEDEIVGIKINLEIQSTDDDRNTSQLETLYKL